LEKADEFNQELKRHALVLERATDEHKRVIRKRDKELDQLRTDLEKAVSTMAGLTHKVRLLLRVHAFVDRFRLVYETRRRNQCSTSRKEFVERRTQAHARQCLSM
jgi:hypothetical protein